MKESGGNKDKEWGKWRVRGREQEDQGKIYPLCLSPEWGKEGEWATLENKKKKNVSKRAKESKTLWKHPILRITLLHFRKGIKFRKPFTARNNFCFPPLLGTGSPCLLTSSASSQLPAVVKAPQLVGARMCYLLSPQPWNTISQAGRECVPST